MHDPQATSFNYYCVKIKVYRIVSYRIWVDDISSCSQMLSSTDTAKRKSWYLPKGQ